LTYLVTLSDELGYSAGDASSGIQQRCEAVVRQLERLTQTIESLAAAEKADSVVPVARSPEPVDYEMFFVAAMNRARGSKPIDAYSLRAAVFFSPTSSVA
jgi:hypothetical protein